MDQDYYTIKEVARRLRVHTETIRRKIKAGELVAVQIGDQWRISETAIDAYLRAHESTAEDDDKKVA